MVIVGVPRALLFYEFFPLWEKFFTCLKVEVVTSGPTTKTTLNTGVASAVDETCLPVKVLYGHFLELVGACDFIFLPRMVSVEPKTYICPKFMGLPDLLRNLGYENIIDPVVNLRTSRNYLGKLWEIAVAVGAQIGVVSQTKLAKALTEALITQRRYRAELYQGNLPSDVLGKRLPQPTPLPDGKTIGVIGHPYTIFDDMINMNLFTYLRSNGYKVITPAQHQAGQLIKMARSLPKDLFWTYGRRMVGAALLWHHQHSVDGIINLVTFGCGTDSMTGELIERIIRRAGDLPFMALTVDEHTGEAGFRTRIEAFLDMIEFDPSLVAGGRP